MTLPASIVAAAIPLLASVGRDYDSTGQHVAYWYRAPGSDWKIYRATVAGMLSVLRQVKRNQSTTH